MNLQIAFEYWLDEACESCDSDDVEVTEEPSEAEKLCLDCHHCETWVFAHEEDK